MSICCVIYVLIYIIDVGNEWYCASCLSKGSKFYKSGKKLKIVFFFGVRSFWFSCGEQNYNTFQGQKVK